MIKMDWIRRRHRKLIPICSACQSELVSRRTCDWHVTGKPVGLPKPRSAEWTNSDCILDVIQQHILYGLHQGIHWFSRHNVLRMLSGRIVAKTKPKIDMMVIMIIWLTQWLYFLITNVASKEFICFSCAFFARHHINISLETNVYYLPMIWWQLTTTWYIEAIC